MFKTIYKTSLKNLIRSPLFWLMVIFLTGVAIHSISITSYSQFDFETGKIITDLDKEFKLWPRKFRDTAFNNIRIHIMFYAAPLFTVIAGMLLSVRDYGDEFYQIEKAGGVRSLSYVFGRFCALITLCVPISLAAGMISYYGFLYTRGGVMRQGLSGYYVESFVRLMRIYVFIAIPALIMYIVLTLAIGAVTKSGFAAGVGGIAVALTDYLVNMFLGFRIKGPLFSYISPLSGDMYYYIGTIGNDNAQLSVFRPANAVLKFMIMLAITATFFGIYYVFTRRRTD